MKDSFFSKKRYQGLYTPLYRFKEHGDIENYWIQLRYVCNRDDFQTIKTAKGTALNFDMLNDDGEKIFGDITATHLAELRRRGYILGGNSEPAPESDDETLVSVIETYVYAPARTYTFFDSDIVPIWGLKDTDYSTQSPIVIGEGAGNVVNNQFYGHPIFHVENASLFQTGDHVMYHIVYTFGVNYGVSIGWYRDAVVESYPTRIVYISGNYVELESLGSHYEDDKYIGYDNHNVVDMREFFGILNGKTLPLDRNLHPSPTSGYLLRAYSTRTSKKRECITREDITYHTSFPDLAGLEIFIPQQQTGSEYNDLSRETTVTPQMWKSRVASGDWFIYAEPRVNYDTATGIYELRVKKTPCK